MGVLLNEWPEVVCLQNVHFEFNFKERLREVTLDESDLHYNEKNLCSGKRLHF